MEKDQPKSAQAYISIGAVLGWTAVLLQLYLIILNRTASVPETIIRFFSYFTILTNIMVALYFTLALAKSKSLAGTFFASPKTATAIAVYILVVGLVYNLVLRFLWAPQGLQFIVDELLHSVIPVLYVLYWMIFVPKSALQWRDSLPWLSYPLLYVVGILIRGAFSGFYPYPFIDVNALGYGKVFFNSFILCLVFLLFALGFVAIGKMRPKKAS